MTGPIAEGLDLSMGDAFQAPALMLRTAPCFTVAAPWVSIRIAELGK